MFNSIVLDVVIGLVFIYLLYSLFVTILAELIATVLNLRARNLKVAIDRMLNDEKPLGSVRRFLDSIWLFKNPNNPVVKTFYDQPEIKYLGSSGMFKYPSNFKANSFAKTLMSMLGLSEISNKKMTLKNLKKCQDVSIYIPKKIVISKSKKGIIVNTFNNILRWIKREIFTGKQHWTKSNEDFITALTAFFSDNTPPTEEGLKNRLNKGNWKIIVNGEPNEFSDDEVNSIWEFYQDSKGDANKFKSALRKWLDIPTPLQIDPETAKYICGLWNESGRENGKFQVLLEKWFDQTMDHTIEWYKRKMKLITFVIGFVVAAFFYADTFVIVKNISKDEKARDALVSMANSYVQNYQENPDTSKAAGSDQDENFKNKMDSLLTITEQLQDDIVKANNILGLGGWPPDTVKLVTDSKKKQKRFTPLIDARALPDSLYVIELICKKDTSSDKETYCRNNTLKEVFFSFQILSSNKEIEDVPNYKCQEKVVLKTATKDIGKGKIVFNFTSKLRYFLWLCYYHFFGFFVTAVAISLGAPFWFDLLNKVMNLKTSQKEETNKKPSSDTDTAQAI